MSGLTKAVWKFHEVLKKLSMTKQYYSINDQKIENIYVNLQKDGFDNYLFYGAFRNTFSDYYRIFISDELAWKIINNHDILKHLRETSDEVNFFFRDFTYDDFSRLKNFEMSIFISTQCLMLMSLMTHDIGNEIEMLDLEVNNPLPNGTKTYFRGLSDYSYGLLPTMLRDVKRPANGIIDFPFIQNAYKNANLEDRYKDRIGNISKVYSYLAFMQHSREYSPLLDFTENKNIAISFACSNVSNYNSYINTDAAVLEIRVPLNQVIRDESECDNHIKNIDIYKCNTKKLTFNTKIRGKLLPLCTITDFEVKAYLIDLKTNDRMRYQQGCFLLFEKAVITSSDVIIPFGTSPHVTKCKIKKKNKKSLYEGIEHNMHWLDADHLMDPYKYFAEAPIEW